MNRFAQQFSLTLEKRVVNLYAQVTIGATGAPTLVTANSKGIRSIARNSAGDYTITLQDNFVKFLGMDLVTLNSTGISASPNLGIKALAVSTVPGTIEFVMSAASSATDPASGDTLYIHLSFGDSTAP